MHLNKEYRLCRDKLSNYEQIHPVECVNSLGHCLLMRYGVYDATGLIWFCVDPPR